MRRRQVFPSFGFTDCVVREKGRWNRTIRAAVLYNSAGTAAKDSGRGSLLKGQRRVTVAVVTGQGNNGKRRVMEIWGEQNAIRVLVTSDFYEVLPGDL